MDIQKIVGLPKDRILFYLKTEERKLKQLELVKCKNKKIDEQIKSRKNKIEEIRKLI